jgi:predicted Zn finger-like uncharacterized protein
MNIECPECKHIFELDHDDLPERACDSSEVECPVCEYHFDVGWYATAELR